jgi:hypothetical protein
MASTPIRVTQAETIAELLAGSKRSEVPIRKTFVQQGRGKVRVPGPVARLCSHHDERGLDLYLLLHARASADPFDVVLAATVWARMLGLSPTASAHSAVSKAFRRLEELRLITRGRAGNRSRVKILAEDGSGEPYAHPSKGGTSYMKLPYAYWEDGWYQKLEMPGKTLLLIALSLNNMGFILPEEKGPDWYGLSPDTVGRGLTELQQHQLLDVAEIPKPAPLAPEGFTLERRYTLRVPFVSKRQKLATVTKLPA